MTAPVLTVVGASGWFGRTLIHEYVRAFGLAHVGRLRLFGSRDHEIRLGGDQRAVRLPVRALADISSADVEDSDALLWYAAILRHRIDEVGRTVYRELNDEIAERVFEVIARFPDLPVVFASSGVAREATMVPAYDDDPYTHLKLAYEDRLSSRGRVSVLYPYAMTGMYLQDPDTFALGSFVRQARTTGRIVITAPGPVTRSYGSVHDLSRFLLATVAAGELPRTVVPVTATLDLVQLAVEVLAALEVPGEVEVGDLSGRPSVYVTADCDYVAQLASRAIRPTSLAEQIRVTASGPAFGPA